MKELTLKEYFLGNVSIDVLSQDVKDSQEKTGFETSAVYIDQINETGEFIISIDHLVLLCDAAINGDLTMTDLNTIAFSLVTSEFFTWDTESTIGKRIETVIYNWDNPDIGFDLSIDNVKLWKDYLLTGNYGLDFELLKSKK